MEHSEKTYKELKELNLELNESRRKLVTLMNNLPGIAYRCLNDRDWTMEFISSGCRDLTGYDVDELLYNRILSYNDCIHPDDRKIVWDSVQSGVNNRRPYRMEYRIITKSGMEKWVWEQGCGVFSGSGELMALEGFITDITEIKHYQIKLSESERRLSTLISNLPGIVYRCRNDRDWTMEFLSSGCLDITGYDIGDLIHNRVISFNSLIHKDDREKVWQHIQAAISKSESFEIRYRIVSKSGTVVWVWDKGRAVFDKDGNTVALEGIVNNITDIVRKDEQIRQIQKMELIGTLAGGIAHDFNNILGGIIGGAELLDIILVKEKLLDNEQVSKYLNTIKNASSRASELIKQLLLLSRKHEVSLSNVDLNLSMKNVIDICVSSFPKSIEIKSVPYPEPALINADPTHVEQIILNLCVNASHAMTIMREKIEREGGILRIEIKMLIADNQFINAHHEAKDGCSYYIISVSDTGVGIDEAYMKNLFEPFVSTKKDGAGSGLGLTIVNSITKQYGGFIDVVSERGKGSTFNVFIPQVKSGESCTEDESGEVRKRVMYSGLILVVDDEEVMRTIAEGALKEFGFSVITTDGGYSALDIFRERWNEIDAVLLDVSMPGLSCMDVYLEMKKINPGVKVILTSGYVHGSMIEEMLSIGARQFIPKPYKLDILAEKLIEIIRDN